MDEQSVEGAPPRRCGELARCEERRAGSAALWVPGAQPAPQSGAYPGVFKDVLVRYSSPPGYLQTSLW
ncbi:hypothetical protein TREES_T100015119 [Tupaia chinensis]|uniref:Uncharacterized protein n=1 Tax=Tupaia chinensis TaxID=246437 RepID=L9KG08_TUPCH|nr:hypothetical protein TREES_T100015119 [Tupaia chinensis]